MKKYLCIYPFCVVNEGLAGTFIFNPKNKAHIIIRDKIQRTTDSYVFPIETENSITTANKIVQMGLGYIIETSISKPFLRAPQLMFTSSIEKEAKSFGFNTGWHTNSCIKSMSILLNNNSIPIIADTLTCAQACFPIYHHQTPKVYEKVISEMENICLNCPNLEGFVLSGDIDESLICLLDFITTKYKGSVLVRTSVSCMKSVPELYNKYKDIHVDILMTTSDDRNKISSVIKSGNSGISFSVLLDSAKYLGTWTKSDMSLSYIPIIVDKERQQDLIRMMLLTSDDILNTNSSVDECLRKQKLNTSLFGNVTLSCDGDVFLGEEKIGNIATESILNLITNALGKRTNAWTLTRKHNKDCKFCIFSILCPNLSIYEREGLIKRACDEKTYKDFN